jgi:hypothetical protein
LRALTGLTPGSFPAATFTATVFRKVDDSHFEAEGTLTIRDHSRPLTLPFTFAEATGRATVTAAVTLQRNDYGIGQGRWATDPSVAQDVKVEIALEATRHTLRAPCRKATLYVQLIVIPAKAGIHYLESCEYGSWYHTNGYKRLSQFVIPAKAGIHRPQSQRQEMDPGFRRE